MKKFKYKRFPGDTIVVPMLIGVVLNSFVPQALQIGGFFTGMVNGTSALVGVFLLFLGATIDVKSTPRAIKIGAVIIVTKVALSVILGLAVAFLFGDNFLGLSSLAIISAISVANNALYSGITAQYGDDSEKGAVAITSLSVGPTVTMIALSSAGLASISVWAIVGSILPLIIGIVLGNCSPWFKQTLSAGVTPSIITVGLLWAAACPFSSCSRAACPAFCWVWSPCSWLVSSPSAPTSSPAAAASRALPSPAPRPAACPTRARWRLWTPATRPLPPSPPLRWPPR